LQNVPADVHCAIIKDQHSKKLSAMKITPLFLLFSLIAATLSLKAQTFPVGHMSINFVDPARSGGYTISGGITMSGTGRTVGTEVYYPSAAAAGDNQPVAMGEHPVVVFGHGFVMTWDSYDNIFEQLASEGYIVLLPRTEGGFSPVHAEFGADLRFLVTAAQSLNSISSPPALATFNGKVKAKSAIGGHSMGAGSSFLGAASNTDIACLFNFAAATTTPSSITAAANITVPTLIISGEIDCVADTNVQNNHYSGLSSLVKFHVILDEQTHCDFGNGSNFNCTFGQNSSGCGNEISNTIAFQRYMSYVQNFLDNQLKEDCAAGQVFMDSVNTASGWRAGLKKQGSIACTSTGLSESTAKLVSVYPNPAQVHILISTSTIPQSIIVYDLSGREVKIKNLPASLETSLDVSELQPGIYFVKIRQGEKSNIVRFVKN
jgi:dienelactone hydrolase